MKSLIKIDFLCFGLTLLLSLVSFSSGIYQSFPEVVKTELVVKNSTPCSRFSIQFHKANKVVFASLYRFYNPSFYLFINDQKLKHNSTFKAYTTKIRSLTIEQLQTKLYVYHNQKTLYEDFIV